MISYIDASSVWNDRHALRRGTYRDSGQDCVSRSVDDCDGIAGEAYIGTCTGRVDGYGICIRIKGYRSRDRVIRRINRAEIAVGPTVCSHVGTGASGVTAIYWKTPALGQ